VYRDEHEDEVTMPASSPPDAEVDHGIHRQPDADGTREDAADDKDRSRLRGAIEWLVVIAGAVAVALLVKTFLLQAFYIPSGSMLPTLEVGDRVLVNKLSYQWSDVGRGDLIVFERPDSEHADDIKDLIKRVIALPGEELVIKDGRVYIDGQALSEPYLPAGTTTSPQTLRCSETDPCVIPQSSVWVMGDNRNGSRDSRSFGAIPDDDIVGKAFIRVWPLNRFGLL
jgi:signal peptidase I